MEKGLYSKGTLKPQELFRIHHAVTDTSDPVWLHHHDYYEILYCLSNGIQYTVESRNFCLMEGTLLLISPQELHQLRTEEPGRRYERLAMWVSRDFMERASVPGMNLAACFDPARPEHQGMLRLGNASQKVVKGRLEEILQESEAGTQLPGAALKAQALLLCFLIELNRLAASYAEMPQVPEDATQNLIASVMKYIEQNPAEPLTLPCLSRRFFVDQFYLSRTFSRVTGCALHQYILQKRLLMAVRQLEAGTPPQQAALACGFEDYSNFYRQFKKYYGLSPRAYAARRLERLL